jgi:hypothetical protein
MSRLRQVIYISQATRDLSDQEIRQIVDVAAANNRVKQITGALLYLESSFIQVLEGEAEAIANLLDKLRRDTRHENLRLLSDFEIEERQFEDWSMGLIESSKVVRPKVVSEISALPAAADRADNDEHYVPLPETVMMMRRLYDTDKVLQRARGLL